MGKMEKKGTFEIRENCLLIRLPEEVDHHNAKEIRQFADYYLNDERVEQIVFDFESTIFMDSSGIGVIMGRYRQVIFKGGRIGGTGVKAGVERIFKVSGLYKIIERYESETEAFLRPVTEYYAGR